MMITQGSEHRLRQPPSLKDSVNWVILAKQVLHDKPDKLNTLYKTVFAFRDHKIDTPTMVNTIAQLLHGHTNLLSSINTFLPEGYSVGAQDHGCLSLGIDFVNKIYRRFGKDRQVFSSFFNIMQEHKDNTVGVLEKVSVLFRNFPELIQAFTAFLPEEPECGPSYRRKTTADPVSRYRGKLELTVLNDDWICNARTTTVSERPADDEREMAVLWEDKRYDIDMLIERGETVMEHIDDMLTKLACSGLEQTNDNHLTLLDNRYIEYLYGEQGLTMVDLVRKDPRKALPVVKERVDQKVVQLTILRQDMNLQCATDPMQ